MEKFITKTLEIIPFIIEDWVKFSGFKHLNSDELRNIYVAILFKTIHSFEGSLFLLYNFNNKTFFQLTYASAMRDIISDLVLVEYLSIKSNDPNSDIQKTLEIIYADHDLFMEKQLTLNKEFYGNNDGYDLVEKEFLNSISKYKDENGKIKKQFRNRSGVFDKIKYINSHTKKENKNIIKSFYLWYSDLSKLAHFGKRTFDVIEKNFINTNNKNYILNNKYLIILVMGFCIALLDKISNGNEINSNILTEFEVLQKMNNAV